MWYKHIVNRIVGLGLDPCHVYPARCVIHIIMENWNDLIIRVGSFPPSVNHMYLM